MQLVRECCEKVKKDYLKFLKKEKILNKSNINKMNNLKNFYVPMSFWINNKYKKKGDTLILGLSGSQGSGKTTTGNILKVILKKFFKKNVFVISIDDFYKTLKVRNILSKNKHLLFKSSYHTLEFFQISQKIVKLLFISQFHMIFNIL